MKKGLVPMFTIALVLDFSSPKSLQVLKGPFTPSSQLAVYPLRAKDGEKGASSCERLVEKFTKAENLNSWTDNLEADPKLALPVAEVFHKIGFDVQYGLHTIDQVIVDVPFEGQKDSCGHDVCRALTDLEKILAKKGKKLRLQTLTPLTCRLPAKSHIIVENSGSLTPQSIVARAQLSPNPTPPTPAPKNAVAKNAVPPPTPTPPPPPAISIIELRGPPLQIKLVSLESDSVPPVLLRSPNSAQIKAGNWRVSITSPSWLRQLPGWTLQVKPGDTVTMDLMQTLDSQVSWVKSSDDSDMIVEFGPPTDAMRRILIPQGSPSIPMPKMADYKVYRVQK